jgi:hypothetical protein
MAEGAPQMRRVVVGNNQGGQSCVLYDSAAVNLKPDPARPGGGMIEMWCFNNVPVSLAGERDDGLPPFNVHAPQQGAYLRFVNSFMASPGYDVSQDPNAVPLHDPIEDPVLERGDRGGKHAGMSGMHKTRSLDYGFLARGARSLVLDDSETAMAPGDFCVQLGNYHAWANRTDDSLMGYVMIGADFNA